MEEQSKPIESKFYKVDLALAYRIAARIEESLKGQNQVECETALFLTYALNAPGVRGYPELTRNDRAMLVIERAMEAVVKVIVDVGAMTDAQVQFAKTAKRRS